MQLSQPFIRLPLTVDANRLRSEVEQFGPDDWRDHPQGHPGNTALPLIARHGQSQDDGVAGPMAATPHLARCPYVRQVLAALGAPLGRTRLMRLDAGAEATSHIDTNYYWSQRVRQAYGEFPRPARLVRGWRWGTLAKKWASGCPAVLTGKT